MILVIISFDDEKTHKILKIEAKNKGYLYLIF